MPIREDKPKRRRQIKEVNTETEKVTVDEYKGTVTVTKGIVKNVGDYSSARISVGITLPIQHTREDLSEARKTMTKAMRIVDDELENQSEELIAHLRSLE